jgi:hypothetical protein
MAYPFSGIPYFSSLVSCLLSLASYPSSLISYLLYLISCLLSPICQFPALIHRPRSLLVHGSRITDTVSSIAPGTPAMPAPVSLAAHRPPIPPDVRAITRPPSPRRRSRRRCVAEEVLRWPASLANTPFEGADPPAPAPDFTCVRMPACAASLPRPWSAYHGPLGQV